MNLDDAVNTVLTLNGLAPVTGVKLGAPTELAKRAVEYLLTVSREVQIGGQGFNIDVDEVLTVPDSGILQRPSGALVVTGRDQDYGRVTTRGNLLINTETGDEFFEPGSKVRVRITSFYNFECIPEHVQNFIIADSALRLGMSLPVDAGSSPRSRLGVMERRRGEARAEMMRHEASVSGTRINRTKNVTDFLGELPG